MPATGAARLSRRTFLGAAGTAAAATAVLGASPAAAATAPSLAEERAMIIQVAETAIVFPVRPSARASGQAGRVREAIARLAAGKRDLPPVALALSTRRRPTMPRLLNAERSMSQESLSLARSGAAALIGAGLLGAGQAALLSGIGRMVSTATSSGTDALHATVALAIATVFPTASSASAERAAQEWLGPLRIMHERGTLQHAIEQRGIR